MQDDILCDIVLTAVFEYAMSSTGLPFITDGNQTPWNIIPCLFVCRFWNKMATPLFKAMRAHLRCFLRHRPMTSHRSFRMYDCSRMGTMSGESMVWWSRTFPNSTMLGPEDCLRTDLYRTLVAQNCDKWSRIQLDGYLDLILKYRRIRLLRTYDPKIAPGDPLAAKKYFDIIRKGTLLDRFASRMADMYADSLGSCKDAMTNIHREQQKHSRKDWMYCKRYDHHWRRKLFKAGAWWIKPYRAWRLEHIRDRDYRVRRETVSLEGVGENREMVWERAQTTQVATPT
jgi:hypothetical protein